MKIKLRQERTSQNMSLLTELDSFVHSFLQIYRAYGAVNVFRHGLDELTRIFLWAVNPFNDECFKDKSLSLLTSSPTDAQSFTALPVCTERWAASKICTTVTFTSKDARPVGLISPRTTETR